MIEYHFFLYFLLNIVRFNIHSMFFTKRIQKLKYKFHAGYLNMTESFYKSVKR